MIVAVVSSDFHGIIKLLSLLTHFAALCFATLAHSLHSWACSLCSVLCEMVKIHERSISPLETILLNQTKSILALLNHYF